jgi:kynureninase
LLEIKTPGQEHINEEDILQAIETHKDSIAVVLIGAVNYYTGQVFDLQKITQAAHKYGILVGFDLAHAIGNIELNLHEWEVDFASWCTYKYLNSGPGGVSGIYIHEKHATNTSLKRLAGWWGYDKSSRFKMEQGFVPIPTAEGWQLSNAPVLSMAALKASLEIFEQAGFQNLRKKSIQLTAYLEFVLEEVKKENNQIAFEIITPPGKQRGSQLSIVFSKDGKKVFDYLFKHGVMTDWREPNVIRMAPVALYNSFTDIYQFGQVLKNYS